MYTVVSILECNWSARENVQKKARPLFWKVKELALELYLYLYLGTIAIGPAILS